jgi:homoserine O-succinyltransferase
MPIILPEGLASAALLRREGIEVLNAPPVGDTVLRIGLLNLMPDKTSTEAQFARLLGATRQPVELVLGLPCSHRPGVEGTERYGRWSATSLPRKLDGLIVTGAPLEHVPFEDVIYWRELVEICDWAATHVGSTIYVCWAAFAALWRFHGVPLRMLPRKLFGIFAQQVMAVREPLLDGLGITFACAVSRHAEVSASDVPWQRGLACLAQSPRSGLCLIGDERRNALYMFNHLEYDADTLGLEYVRDRSRRADVSLPENYWPDDDLSKHPPFTWRRPAEKFFANWLASLADRRRAQARSRYRAALV